MRKRPPAAEHTSKGSEKSHKKIRPKDDESSVQAGKRTMARIDYPQIVLFGDSIAAIAFRKGGYGSDLASRVSSGTQTVELKPSM